jgi:hypothetical protein
MVRVVDLADWAGRTPVELADAEIDFIRPCVGSTDWPIH